MADDDIIVGSAAVEIVPSAKGWIAKAKAQILPQAEELGRAIGDTIADQISDQVRTALTEGLAGSSTVAKAKGRESGQDFGGEFGRQAQARIQAALKALPKANIGVATTEAEQKLKDLRAELAMLGDKRIGVDLDATDALAEMARLQLELETLARDTVDIDVRVDTGAALAELVAFQAFAQSAGGGVNLGAIAGDGAGMASNLSKAAGSMGKLGAGAVVLATTIGPIVGAAAGIAAALAAPLGAATVGGLLFAGLGAMAVKDVEETRKAMAKLETQIASATDPAVVKRLTGDLADLRASLSDTEKGYLDARDGLATAFDKLLDGPAGDALLGTITQGLEVLADLLPEVEPLIVAVGDALSDALDDVDAEGFGKWIDKLTELAGPAITDVIDILSELGGALDAVLTMGSDTGESALGGLADSAERLNEYLRSAEGQEELQEFFEWLATDGKDAGEALWDLGAAFADWLIAVEPVGSALLDVTGALAELFSVFQSFNEFNWNLITGDFDEAFGGLYDTADGIAAAFAPLGGIIRAPFIVTFEAIDLVANKLAEFFDALGRVPGFGWADDAAEKLRGTAEGARRVAKGLRDIPGNTPAKVTLDDKASGGIKAIRDSLYVLSNGTTVPIKISMKGQIPSLNDIYERKATGGPVFGPGTGTSDSIPTLLSNGEHVWTAAEVQAAGGHGAILAMRRMIASGASGFASGGPVGAGGSFAGMGSRDIERAVAAGTRQGMDGAKFVDQNGRRLTLSLQGG